MLPPIEEILANFELLDDWEERYRYLIELGRMMPPLPGEARTDANKVMGCASQVWLETKPERANGDIALNLRGDSDAHIVRGLIALLVALLSGRPAAAVAETDPQETFRALGLAEHLTPQRSNGLRSMVERIKRDARAVAAGAH
ncbi:MAG TPA: SufE family protein [Beijerinckiaceae bacterium]|jgi:cysteine desulfuration protein SufE